MHRCYFIPIITLEGRAELPGRVASLSRSAEMDEDTRRTVSEIFREVGSRGLDAVFSCTLAFDGVDLDPARFRVPVQAMTEARERLDSENPSLMDALRAMIEGIRSFAEGQRAVLRDLEKPLPGGGSVGERWVPLRSAGVYIPGGRAFYPSTLAMTVLPAQVAGVGRILGTTPPRIQGLDPLVLATASLLGLEELYQVGGAQALAWMALGEPAVDLVAGPGNRFVEEAKRQLVGRCGIDALAGPTELLVIADGSANPAWVAEDLLAQAEHDPDAASVLISPEPRLLEAVQRELATRVQTSPRREILEKSLGTHGRLFLGSRELALAFAQAWAPEHLELAVAAPETWLPEITTAGAVFCGHFSAESFGDYGAGPNHVLPTGRSARHAGPLGVATFLKRQSVLRLEEGWTRRAAPGVTLLAEAEGLFHHARSAELRSKAPVQTQV